MNIVFSKPDQDKQLDRKFQETDRKLEDELASLQDHAYECGLEIGKEKTIAAILVALEELEKQFVSQDDDIAADQLRGLIDEINDA